MEATVLVAKCQKSDGIFGIRVEKLYTNGDWLFTWAFELSEERASKERYTDKIVSGKIYFDPSYPGCPHCGAKNFMQCSNYKKITCCSDDLEYMDCSHCGNGGPIKRTDTFDNISGNAF